MDCRNGFLGISTPIPTQSSSTYLFPVSRSIFVLMGELIGATESVSPVVALLFPFIPVLILLGFWAAAGGGFIDDDDDDEPRGGKMIPITVPAGA